MIYKKHQVLSIILLFTSIITYSQTVSYAYDNAGNCIERSLLIGNKSVTIDDQNDYFVEESIAETIMKIYPNPTKGMLRVDFGIVLDDKTIVIFIYDMRGRVVYSNQVVGGGSLTIDLTSQLNGMYIMKVGIGEKETRWKILKEG